MQLQWFRKQMNTQNTYEKHMFSYSRLDSANLFVGTIAPTYDALGLEPENSRRLRCSKP